MGFITQDGVRVYDDDFVGCVRQVPLLKISRLNSSLCAASDTRREISSMIRCTAGNASGGSPCESFDTESMTWWMGRTSREVDVKNAPNLCK